MLTIIDYGAGNVRSLANVIEHLGFEYRISDKAEEIEAASKILFPGQGAAKSGMENLKKKGLINVIKNTTKPFLGICVGMQLLFDFSEEDDTECLGIIPGKVKKFKAKEPTQKVPQIGWNNVTAIKEGLLFKGIDNNSYFYFVHSYACYPKNESCILAKTDYIESFCSMVQKDNFYGAQFHVEKSGEDGLKMLRNFIE